MTPAPLTVHGNQTTQRLGRQLLEHDRVGRLVALEDLGLDERLVLGLFRSELLDDLFLGLAERQRLGLREEIGEQDLVVLAASDWVERLHGRQEVARDELGALVDELVECVLAVRARLAPDNRSGFVVDKVAGLGDGLSVGFHVALLEVVGKLVQVLVVREQCLGLGAVKVVVPDSDEGQDDGQVVLERSLGEVDVHLVCAEQELFKVFVADDEGDAETDGGPERVSATDPVPELEHVAGGDTKGLDGLGVGGKGHKVLGDVCFLQGCQSGPSTSKRTHILGRLQEPVSCTLGVGNRLLGGKRLGGNDEERRFRVALLGDLGEIRAVNVGHEVRLQVPLRVVLERLGDHDRSEIGATDTDVDDRVNGLACVSLPFAGTNRVGKLLDVVEHTLHLVGTFFLDLELLAGRKDISQGDVQDGTIFGRVDVFPGKHGISERFHLGLLRERQQLIKDLARDQVFRVVEQDAVDVARRRGLVFAGELLETIILRVGKELLELEVLVLRVVQLLQLLPARVFWEG